jgi:aryl-alcohol dehydrogenase-like predicted oxidoreductase
VNAASARNVQLEEKGFTRDQLALCTKAGYLTPDGKMPSDPNKYFFEEYIQRGIFQAKDIAAGSHCMAPRFLQDQLARSLSNIGVDCIDVFYLHNPETQLSEVPNVQFLGRVRGAVHYLESAVAAGKIQFYGMATWNGFRQEAKARGRHVAGGLREYRHRGRRRGQASLSLCAASFNLGMTEAPRSAIKPSAEKR